MEFFFYAAGFNFEPRYACARNIQTKLTFIIGIIDDTYDAYGTYEELQHFTEAMRRFDVGVMDKLPTDNFKLVYETILKFHDEAEEKVRKEGRSYGVFYTKNESVKLS